VEEVAVQHPPITKPCGNCGNEFLAKYQWGQKSYERCCSRRCHFTLSTAWKRSPETVAARFWSNVHKGERCWIWTAAKHRYGYGACGKDYGDTRAHRAAWMLTNGPIPKGKVICHKCETKLCVNPAHLFLGTQADNMADNKAKGKSHYGERAWNVKLTDALVLEMRSLKGTATMRELAERYGVSQPTVWHVLSGRTWKHLNG
jgi:hypothetical protein